MMALRWALTRVAWAAATYGWVVCTRAPGATWWLGLVMGALAAASLVGLVEASMGDPTAERHRRRPRDTWLRRLLRDVLRPEPRSRVHALISSLGYIVALHCIPIMIRGFRPQPFLVGSMAGSFLVWAMYGLWFPTRRPAG